MRTIMQRCAECGSWLDISRDEKGQSVICTCGHVNTITDKNQKNGKEYDGYLFSFAPSVKTTSVVKAGTPAETTSDDFIRQHFIFCTVKR